MTITAITFSPTGSTARMALTAAAQLGDAVQEINLTAGPFESRSFSASDVVVVAVPVYMGRVPAVAAERLRQFSGSGAKAVAIAVYGNRHYDDALLELCDLLKELRFAVVAAGAFVAQHSIVGTIAQGRPDAADIGELKAFAERAKALLQSDVQIGVVPGNRPYKELPFSKRTIVVADTCVSCGLCAVKCPVGAIPKTNTKETDADSCIGCMSCINRCPQGARDFPAPVREKTAEYMSQYAEPRKNETYFAE